MDCVQAQEIISAALDQQPVDADALAQAKEHCRGCADCGAFVRAQLAVKQMPLPTPPADLVDRVMSAVRAEAARASAEAALPPQAPEVVGPAVVEPPDSGTSGEPSEVFATPAPLSASEAVEEWALRLGSRRLVIVLASIAAVMVFGTVVVVEFGTRQMTAGPQTATTVPAPTSAGAPSYGGTGAGSTPEARDGATTSGSSAPKAAGAGAPQFLVFNKDAYQSIGSSNVGQGSLHSVGSVTTALSGTGSPTQRGILAGADTNNIYVLADDKSLVGFQLVTRQYKGRTYRLLAGRDIPGFGIWPSLPPEISPPTAADGSPTFIQDGNDDNGVPVYRLLQSSSTDEIGIAPDSPATDPAAGNPNWTLWTASP